MTRYSVRKHGPCEIVTVGNETLAIFRDGKCIASGLPNLNEARAWIARQTVIDRTPRISKREAGLIHALCRN